MSKTLQQLSVEFARELSALFQGCLKTVPEFVVVRKEDEPDKRRIGPQLDDAERPGFGRIPLFQKGMQGDHYLELKVEFEVMLDPDESNLSVHESAFGLWIQPGQPEKKKPTRGKPRPVFRIEYDRDASRKPAAHVHLHAESSDWGWIYGKAGLPMQRVQQIHFPVGGRRYRPSVEDLLTFLDRERIFNDWRPGWEEVVEKSRSLWEERQLRSAVKADAKTAVDKLQEMGYRVTPPAEILDQPV